MHIIVKNNGIKIQGERAVGVNGVGGTGRKIFNLFSDLQLPDEPIEKDKPIQKNQEIVFFPPHDTNQNQVIENKSTNQNDDEHLKKQSDAKIPHDESKKWIALVNTAKSLLGSNTNLKRKIEPDEHTRKQIEKKIKIEEIEVKEERTNEHYEQYDKIKVKQEEVEANDEQSYAIVKVEEKEIELSYNHTGPILRSATDPTKSALKKKGKKTRPSSWGALDTELAHLSYKDKQKIKKQIIIDVNEWLAADGRPRYAEMFDELIEAAIPVDYGPERGWSCFAKKALKVGTVLGPYGGVLHETLESLNEEMERLGESKVKAYLFQTSSQNRNVSATEGKYSNILRLMNTAQLPGTEKYGENNVIPIAFGEFIFYIVTRPVETGEELFVDYGEYY